MKHGRKSERIFRRLEVTYLTDTEHCAITSNISETGIFIRTLKKFQPGTVLNLRLLPPNSPEMPLKGEVVRITPAESRMMGTRKGGIGIHLIDPPPAYINYVKSMIE